MQQLIDALENLVQRSLRVPASGKVLIDEAAVHHIIALMRDETPDEVAIGQQLAKERDRILGDARAQARRIVEDAQIQAQTRADEQAILQIARQRAKEIQSEAEQRAAGLRAETDAYIVNQLNGLENRIQRLLREIQAGQRALAQEPPKRTDTGSF
jgi:vacuolar-type H+-ATPase subunit H